MVAAKKPQSAKSHNMNKSNAIDRHTPQIPPSIWQDLTPDQEVTYTALKNKIIIPNCGIPKIVKSKGRGCRTSERHIKDEHLQEAMDVISGNNAKPSNELLEQRGITIEDVEKYNMLDAASLVKKMTPETASALTLKLPPELPKPHEINGIIVPIYSRGLFLGFATWIVNNKYVKYSFSIPNRLCFGDNPSEPEVTIVEGIFDSVAMNRIGINTMAMGDSQPNYFKMWMAAKYGKIKLLFDNDMAGMLGCIKAHLILTQMLRKPCKDIEILSVTGQRDPEQSIAGGQVDFPKLIYKEMISRLQSWKSNVI